MKEIIKNFKENLKTIFAVVLTLFIYQFDGLDLVLKKKKLSEKEVVWYTILNYLFFTKLATSVAHLVIQLDQEQWSFLNMYFCFIGIACGLYICFIDGKKFNIVTIYICFKLICRVKIMFLMLMMVISLIAKIPVIGPIGLFLFALIEGTMFIVKEIKSIFFN